VSGVVKEPNEAPDQHEQQRKPQNMDKTLLEHKKDKRQTYMFTKQQNIDTQKVFMNS
jgi:hypothetical protein